MGVGVGAMVGAAVGVALGAIVGAAVGAADGPAVGAAVGAAEGAAVVGTADGEKVGEKVGTMVVTVVRVVCDVVVLVSVLVGVVTWQVAKPSRSNASTSAFKASAVAWHDAAGVAKVAPAAAHSIPTVAPAGPLNSVAMAESRGAKTAGHSALPVAGVLPKTATVAPSCGMIWH